ncbi:hypothetical protein [Escherichia coli]
MRFLQTLRQRLPQHKDNIMTLAEHIEQGRLEGKRETACIMLKH